MIHTAHVLNDLTHEAAYAQGYVDAIGGDPRLARSAEEAYRNLSVILDHAEQIAPWENPPPFDGEEE